MNKTLEQLGRRIRAGRALRDISQADLAKKIHSDQRTISAIELGHRDIRISTLNRIAGALDVPSDWLLRPDLVETVVQANSTKGAKA